MIEVTYNIKHINRQQIEYMIYYFFRDLIDSCCHRSYNSTDSVAITSPRNSLPYCILKRITGNDNFQANRYSSLASFIKYSRLIVSDHKHRIVRLHFVFKPGEVLGSTQIVNSVRNRYSSFYAFRVVMGYDSGFFRFFLHSI